MLKVIGHENTSPKCLLNTLLLIIITGLSPLCSYQLSNQNLKLQYLIAHEYFTILLIQFYDQILH